jgi:hypothetical protein
MHEWINLTLKGKSKHGLNFPLILIGHQETSSSSHKTPNQKPARETNNVKAFFLHCQMHGNNNVKASNHTWMDSFLHSSSSCHPESTPLLL